MYALASQGQTAAEALAFYRTVIAKGPNAEEADPSVKARSGRHVQLQRLLALLWCDSESGLGRCDRSRRLPSLLRVELRDQLADMEANGRTLWRASIREPDEYTEWR